jgi:UDP-N-acetylglucosamine acyltransferase
VHIAHDCQVGDNVIMANNATLASHVSLGDHVIIGGLTALHQNCRVGKHAMVGGCSAVGQDIVPFAMAAGNRCRLRGLNIVGMKRRNFTRERLATVRAFYQELFHGPGVFADRLARVQPLASEDPAIAQILTFIGDGKHRPLCLPADDRRH